MVLSYVQSDKDPLQHELNRSRVRRWSRSEPGCLESSPIWDTCQTRDQGCHSENREEGLGQSWSRVC